MTIRACESNLGIEGLLAMSGRHETKGGNAVEDRVEPGEELDALVARHIFGWPVCPEGFQPSTDIRDAWRVVETMRERGYKAVVTAHLPEHGNSWSVYVVEYWGTAGNLAAWTLQTAPGAICLAALSALGVTEHLRGWQEELDEESE